MADEQAPPQSQQVAPTGTSLDAVGAVASGGQSRPDLRDRVDRVRKAVREARAAGPVDR